MCNAWCSSFRQPGYLSRRVGCERPYGFPAPPRDGCGFVGLMKVHSVPVEGLSTATLTHKSGPRPFVGIFPLLQCNPQLSTHASIDLVGKVWREPAFDLGARHVFATGIILDLIARDEIDREIPRLGMAEVE